MASATEMTVFEAARVGELRVLRKWLDTERDVNRKDDHDFTALHWAVRNGVVGAVSLLLEHRPDLEERTVSGDTPLHYAAADGDLEIVKKLVEAGASVTASNYHGNTPLHYACFWRRRETCKFLVSKGARIMAANKFAKVPVDRAGPDLGMELRTLATDLGQSLELQEMPTVDTQEVVGRARAMFVAAHANTAFNINSQTIQYEEQLGSEAVNTVVLRGTWAGYTVAVKKVVGERFRTSDLDALREELNPLKALYHTNVLPILGAITTTTDVGIVSIFQPLGSLEMVVNDPTVPLTTEQLNNFVKQIARGLTFLHSQSPPIVHCNLKPSNILIAEDLTLKLTDYGVRTLLNSSVRADSIIEPQWTAPELLRVPDTEIEDLRPCDVFSFGMTIYAVAERRNPHAGMNAMQMGMKILRTGLRPDLSDDFPPQFKPLMSLCWNVNPSNRAKMAQLMPILERI